MRIYIYLILLLLPISIGAQICVGEAGQVTWQGWQNLTENFDIDELYVQEYYPTKGDVSTIVYKAQSPINFDDDMGGRISGFISVPSNDDVTFNLTGDDITRFYLSTDSNPDNMVLQAYTDGWSNVEEHDKYPEQTSSVIPLESGTYYYFELHYYENGGGDHISLYWKTIHEDPDNWTLINSNYLNDVGCLPAVCPERGTACNDGLAYTTNDREDGHCNCIGTPTNGPACLGEHREITVYTYDSIPGNNLTELYADPDYPGTPGYSFELDYLTLGRQSRVDSVGHILQVYLLAPATGDYIFNLTGNNYCKAFISSNDDPANMSNTELDVPGYTDPTEHDKYGTQTSGTLSLTKGNLYYIELHHKEGAYSESFSIFWQTPFTAPDRWEIISDFYIYDYTCEVVCIPQGVTCNDGDPFTNNDMYDNNCACVGTPCTSVDCDDPLASYTPYPKCDVTDRLDNRTDNNWLSCQVSDNPNDDRADSHWIQYDLGSNYRLYNSHIWNYNESENTAQGMETVAIDYSLDGTNWTQLDTYNWPLADGTSEYSGFVGPDFMDVIARYVLITSLDATGTCRGIGKVMFNASICPDEGTMCDDGDPLTLLDRYDNNCNCLGISSNNPCLQDTLDLLDTLLYSGSYTANRAVISANTLDSISAIYYASSREILLTEGFDLPLGTQFLATIEPCGPAPVAGNNPSKKREEGDDTPILKVIPSPDPEYQYIQFYIEKPGKYKLDILNSLGDIEFYLFNVEFLNKGYYHKKIRTKKFKEGVYQAFFQGPGVKETDKLVVTPLPDPEKEE